MSRESQYSICDLPEDHSTVLLLGVTRIPTSPLPPRRPCTLPVVPISSSPPPQFLDNSHKSSAQARRTSFSTRRQHIARKTSSSSTSASVKRRTEKNDDFGKCSTESATSYCNETSETVMDQSVDSIGTCSLDVEASAELADWSEASSGGTLRSESINTPSSEHRLPSYLSLACTVNGYSNTINYDPVRLAKSRDNSPHRLEHDNLTPRNTPTYSIQNNLLSPPYLVPLPTHIKPKMSDLTHYYQSTKTMTITHQESHYASTIYGKDTTDACFENNIKKLQSKCTKEYSSNTESKSFIQQRVERLYGPGALAQGFFVKKRQKNHESESSDNESFAETGIEKETSPMKQSSSSPALPVLRHLRPEFRAQLPIISSRKKTENTLPKSSTEPTLKEEVKLNGHSKQIASSEGDSIADATISEDSGEKDGNYFLKILQNETNRLLKLADNVEHELENSDSIPEEIVGKIRSASGKARLLVSQKMQQFKGLCTNNITQGESEAFPTTSEDLQGFWDMVMLQVHQVDALLKEIDQLKANNWEEIKKEVVSNKNGINGKTKKMVVKPKPSAANEEARKKREAERRLMIEERRKAMKAQKQQQSIEIFVPESS